MDDERQGGEDEEQDQPDDELAAPRPHDGRAEVGEAGGGGGNGGIGHHSFPNRPRGRAVSTAR